MRVAVIGMDIADEVGAVSLTVPQLVASVRAHPELAARIELQARIFNTDHGVIEITGNLLELEPDLLCVSLHVWSEPLLMPALRRLCATLPRMRLILGGPQVQGRADGLLQLLPAACAIVIGEGEATLVDLLERLLTDLPLDGTAGAVTRDASGRPLHGPPRPLLEMRRLDQLPSPYISGTLALRQRLAYVETARGCPFSCGYCDFGHQERRVRYRDPEAVAAELRVLRESGVDGLVFIDPVFNARSKRAVALLGLAAELGFTSISAQIYAELLDEPTALALARFQTMLGIGLQSTSPSARKQMGRELNWDRFTRGVELLDHHRIPFKMQLICGLPGDDLPSFCRSMDQALALHPIAIEAFVLQVLPGTRFHRQAADLGMRHETDPPYTVYHTPSFPWPDLIRARTMSMAAYKLHGLPEARDRIDRGLTAQISPSRLYAEAAEQLLRQGAIGNDQLLQPRQPLTTEQTGCALAAMDQLLGASGVAVDAGRLEVPVAESTEAERVSYLGWEITRSCNMLCPHCFTDSRRHRDHEKPELVEVKQLMDQAIEAGIQQVAFSGGEPLLRRDLEQIIAHGRAGGVREFSLVTNGVLATRKRLRSLRDAGLSIVQVSIDGVDARLHCRVRGCKPRHFELACEAVFTATDLGLMASVGCFLSAEACHQVEEMYELARRLGAFGLRYCSFVPTGRARDLQVVQALVPGPDDLRRFTAALVRSEQAQELDRTRIPVMVDEPFGPTPLHPEFRCTAGHSLVYLEAEGDLYPCPLLIHPPFLIGNVRETPLGELLRSPELRRVASIPRVDVKGVCESCPNHACVGGCRGVAYAVHGDELGPVPHCMWHAHRP